MIRSDQMASEALSPENVGALRVVDLKEELKTRGLATDGKKVNAVGLALPYPGPIVFEIQMEGSAARTRDDQKMLPWWCTT